MGNHLWRQTPLEKTDLLSLSSDSHINSIQVRNLAASKGKLTSPQPRDPGPRQKTGQPGLQTGKGGEQAPAQRRGAQAQRQEALQPGLGHQKRGEKAEAAGYSGGDRFEGREKDRGEE